MHKHEFGTCPECGSLNLGYGDITWNDLTLYPSNVKPDTVDIIWHGDKHNKTNTEEN